MRFVGRRPDQVRRRSQPREQSLGFLGVAGGDRGLRRTPERIDALGAPLVRERLRDFEQASRVGQGIGMPVLERQKLVTRPGREHGEFRMLVEPPAGHSLGHLQFDHAITPIGRQKECLHSGIHEASREKLCIGGFRPCGQQLKTFVDFAARVGPGSGLHEGLGEAPPNHALGLGLTGEPAARLDRGLAQHLEQGGGFCRGTHRLAFRRLEHVSVQKRLDGLRGGGQLLGPGQRGTGTAEEPQRSDHAGGQARKGSHQPRAAGLAPLQIGPHAGRLLGCQPGCFESGTPGVDRQQPRYQFARTCQAHSGVALRRRRHVLLQQLVVHVALPTRRQRTPHIARQQLVQHHP